MNEIVSNDYKEDLLKDNYKLIYPNDETISKNPLNLEFRDSESPGCQYAPITKIKLLDEKGEEYLGRRWTRRIKELYLNVPKESLVIVIDESFQWPEEKEEQLEEKTKKENSERLENKINSLLK